MIRNCMITSLNFKQIFFRRKRFDKKLLTEAIDHLSALPDIKHSVFLPVYSDGYL